MSVHSNQYQTDEEYEMDLQSEYAWDRFNEYHEEEDERKQCEIIWKPVYDEYRRLGYRLKRPYSHQITIEEWLKGEQ